MESRWIFLIFCFFIFAPLSIKAQNIEFSQIPPIPGRIEGKGKYFEIKDSQYLNISLESSEEISIILESIPKVISLTIIESSPNSAILTLKGLKSNKTYYKYQDSYKSEAVFVSDENGTFSWKQDLSQNHYIWIQETKGTIFIRDDEKGGDCYLIGNWSSSTKTCTLTKELQDTIEIDGDYITLNCNDYWLKNEYWVSGLKTHAIYFYNKKGVKIKNCNIVGFDYPILINQSQEIEILENNISKAYGGGIVIQYSQNNKIVKNKILESERGGILINNSPNNYLRENLFENNKSNFGVFSKKIENFIQDIDASNLINGKQIHYLVNQENKIIDVNENPGYIGVINSKGIEIKNVSLKEGNYQQVLFVNSRDSKIENSQISNGSIAGIQILFSSNIEILKNNILNCDYAIYASTLIGAEGKTLENGLISENELVENGGGIGFVNAFGNKIFKNKISKNNLGIYLTNSSNNVINENIISENNFGAITLNLSSNNTLKGNSVLNNGEGIFLDGSSNNIIFENSISKQNGQWGRGIYLLGFYTREGLVKSENNKIYHNNFVQNKENAKVELDYASGNFFDDGYPSGGNYWSDYSGKDENGDGIGDTPYVFGGGKDNYPFMKESGWAKTLPKVLISEVYYNVAEGKGKEGDNEWVIIHNLENLEVDISGWKICSSSTKEYCSDELSIKLPPNGFAILTPTSTTFNYWKIPPEMVKIVLGKKFGSYGLNNDGDNLYLKNNEGNIIDAMSYGNDKTFFDPPCQKVKEGNSLLRYPPDQDTNTAVDFIESEPTIGKNQVPIPIIIFFPKEPVKGVKVKFDASSSTDPDGKILNFEWQIGTTTLFGTTTEFVFNENGEYQITLTVTDNDGATSSTSTTIEVQPFSFAIITDLHIGRGYSDYNSSGFEDSGDGEDYYLTERLKKVVQWVIDNKDNVDCEDTKCSIKFLVVLGDISDSAEKSEFLKAKKILDKLNDPNEDGDISDGIPYVVVFGNHDVWPYTDEKEANSPKGEDFFDEIFWDENTTNTKLMKEILNWQRDESNKNYKNFAFTFGGLNFIGLDFNSREKFMKIGPGVGSDAVLNEVNKKWLEEKLKEFKGEPIILFAHHPFIKKIIGWTHGFSRRELSLLEEKMEDSVIPFNFGGHIHSFEQIHGIFAPSNANKEYPSIGNTQVFTTEALMVGSNGKGVEISTEENGVVDGKKGIVRIVKVFGENEIKPNNWETTETGDEFLAFNPSIGFGFSHQMMACLGCKVEEIPCVELVASAFCDKTKKPFIPIWDFGDGTTLTTQEKVTKCYSKPGNYNVSLTLKDVNSNFSESISKRIEIKENIVAKTIKRTAEQIVKGVEFISEKAKQSFEKVKQIGKDVVYIIKHSEPKIIGAITIDFDKAEENIEFKDLKVDIDFEKKKSLLYMPQWPSSVERSKTLFLPMR